MKLRKELVESINVSGTNNVINGKRNQTKAIILSAHIMMIYFMGIHLFSYYTFIVSVYIATILWDNFFTNQTDIYIK